MTRRLDARFYADVLDFEVWHSDIIGQAAKQGNKYDGGLDDGWYMKHKGGHILSEESRRGRPRRRGRLTHGRNPTPWGSWNRSQSSTVRPLRRCLSRRRLSMAWNRPRQRPPSSSAYRPPGCGLSPLGGKPPRWGRQAREGRQATRRGRQARQGRQTTRRGRQKTKRAREGRRNNE